MLVSCDEMRAIEERAFASGATAESLMEMAGKEIARAVKQFFPAPGRVLVFFGKGHNGGDALVAARYLVACGWEINLRPAYPEGSWSPLTAKKAEELQRAGSSGRGDSDVTVVLDGLLGIGSSGPLRDPIRTATATINRLRHEQNAYVFAIDQPTGLNADTGEFSADTVIADFTLTIGCGKAGLVADAAAHFVGRLAVLPIEGLTQTGGDEVACPQTLAELKPRRGFDTHKTEYGRVAIIAGSMGLTGAAILAAEGALRAGAGLVRLYVTPDIHAIIATAVSPEIMVSSVESFAEVPDTNSDVLALGPGLGKTRKREVLDVIRTARQPMVIDADGLNILAEDLDVLREGPAARLLTPHPGEMTRLTKTDGVERREQVTRFVAEWPVTLLLKGSRTIVGERDRPMSYNSTGNPGMSSGGMGDVLTGVCAALLGQRFGAYDAARVGAWVCGRAAEIAVFEGGRSEESLVASDVIAHLGLAFHQLRGGCL